MEHPRAKELAEQQKRVENRVPKHARWYDDLFGAVGYVDARGAVHGTVLFNDSPEKMHGGLYPNYAKYKPWRWTKLNGLEGSPLAAVDMDDEDWQRVKDWLYKRGLLNDWEID